MNTRQPITQRETRTRSDKICLALLILAIIALLIGVAYSQTPTPTPTATATPAQTYAVTVAWSAPNPADQVTATRIYKKSGTTYQQVTQIAQPADSVALPAVTAGDIYAAAFVAASGLVGARSNDLTMPTVPSSPQNFHYVVTLVGSSQ